MRETSASRTTFEPATGGNETDAAMVLLHEGKRIVSIGGNAITDIEVDHELRRPLKKRTVI